jgi:radical SAM family uncharacterized protein
VSQRKDDILRLLPKVTMPAQYVGAEWNMVRKDPARAALRVCIAFPDTYTIGMSCAAVHVLYGVLNRRPDVYAERAFAPWLDMQAQLRAERVPLCSLETFTPLREFDVLGFSLQYEMGFTNLLDMLELGGIPLRAADRAPSDPLIVVGGACAFNPEPVADFIDLAILGDGEERINDLADTCIALKNSPPRTREEALRFLVKNVRNAYAPALYEVRQAADGRIESVRPRAGTGAPERVEAAMVEDFESAYVPDRPIVPYVETVHDRISVEIMRGCTRGCRFCHAGMTRRPLRVRSVERVLAICEAQCAATGWSEISLASLSSSDYPDLAGLVRAVDRRFSPRGVSINLPSLRVDAQLSDIPKMISGVRKSGLTIAPEAATDRLRRVINKDIVEADLYAGVEAAFAQGWNHVKLYFMAGLPTETDEDVLAIVDVAERVSDLRRKGGRPPALVNVSVAAFVPKPHTPFQWDPMVPPERIDAVRDMLRKRLRRRSVNLRVHHAQRSFLEGVFARGDRRLGRVLLEAHALGCRFDAWDESFDFVKWRQAFERAGLTPEQYACRAFDRSETLPWSHLSAGVSQEFLRAERERADQAVYTPDCRCDACRACGLPRCPRRDAPATA